MTKETIKTDKVTVEEKTVFTSVDGIEFDSDEECIKHEQALRRVYNNRVIPKFKIVTENDFFSNWAGCDDYDYGVIKVTKDNYNDIRMWADANGCFERIRLTLDKNEAVKEQKFTKDYIGQTVVFGLGYMYADGYDNISFYGSTDEFLNFLTTNMKNSLSL